MLITDTFASWSETEALFNNLTNCTVLAWGKGRFIACRQNNVHVVTDPTSVTSGATAHYSNLDASWLWTDADDLSQGIYLSGYSEAESKLYLMSFDTTDAAAGLTIGIPREVWRASDGERILCVKPYAGSAMLLGTSKGVRNCIVIDREGNVSVGPLIETSPGVEVHEIGIWGRYAFFFYGTATGNQQESGRVAKMDLGTFAVAASFESDSPFSVYHGISVVIPSWYEEWQAPIMVISDDGTSYLTSYTQANTSLSPQPALEPGTITFGTSVEKEIKRLEIELDSRPFAFRRNSDNNVSSTPANPINIQAAMVIITRVALNSWTGGPDTLFYQGLSTSDYHWRVRLMANRALEFSWLDDTDTVRTATGSALPSGWDVEDNIWILVEKFGNFVKFYYIKEEGDPTLVPYPNWDEDTWIAAGSVDMGAGYNFKGGAYASYAVSLFAETPTSTGDLLYSFHLWSELWYNFPASRLLSFNPTHFSPDPDGNTWNLSTTDITSPFLKVLYNLDRRGWTNLIGGVITAPYTPTSVHQSLPLPNGVTARNIELLIGTVQQNGSESGHGILDWRLLAEPVPTPRYYRYYVPIMLYDEMATLDGHRLSRDGYAWEYLGYLETLYRNGTAFDFQKPSGYMEPTASTRVRIEEMEFKEFAPTKGASGFGGICLTVLKEVAT